MIIETRIKEWQERLLDLSKRNRLINCKVGPRGVLALEHPTMGQIWERLVMNNRRVTFARRHELLVDSDGDAVFDLGSLLEDEAPLGVAPEQDDFQRCLDSPRLRAEHVLTRFPDKALANHLYRLALNARTALAEQGVNNLFLAFEMLRWYESSSSELAIDSPLMLIPVELTRASVDQPWNLSVLEEEILQNHSLAQLLQTQFGIALPPLPDGDQLDDPEALEQFLSVLDAFAARHPRWMIRRDVVVGIFSFQKIAMWNDLEKNYDQIAGHQLCQVLAGVEGVAPPQSDSLVKPADFDQAVPPSSLHNILDSDSSQLEAILAAKAGASLVLDGPPGTGKSQTIANMIAELLADSKTVLFVSEKAAALEVVKKRLDLQRLGDFCLDCHSHRANKAEVIAELGRCLKLNQEHYQETEEALKRLEESRETLNAYVQALHRPMSALKVTPYQIHGRLLALQDDTGLRCAVPNPLEIDGTGFQKLLDVIGRLVRCHRVLNEHNCHPWRGAAVSRHSLTTIAADIRSFFTRFVDAIPAVQQATVALQSTGILNADPSKRDLDDALKLAHQLVDSPEVPSEWFAQDPRAVANTILKTAAVAQDYIQARTEFSELPDDADQKQILEEWRQVEAAWQRWQGQFDKSSNQTLCGLKNALIRYRDELRHLITLTKTVYLRVSRLSRALNVNVGSAKIRSLQKLTRIGRLVLEVGTALPTWFDDTRMEVFSELASRCASEEEMSQQERTKLAGRLFSTVLDDSQGYEIAVQGEKYERWWRRLLPGWRTFSHQCQSLYLLGQFPPSRELLQDLAAVRRYHQQTERLLRIAQDRPDEIVVNPAQGMNWQRAAQGLKALHELKETLIPIPRRL